MKKKKMYVNNENDHNQKNKVMPNFLADALVLTKHCVDSHYIFNVSSDAQV